LSGPSRTFAYDHVLTDYVDDYTKNSRFVLYDNGAFVLQSTAVTPSGGGYPPLSGAYTVANGIITLTWNVQDTWIATGPLSGNSLTVRYNDRMIGASFYDAVYVLAP
jgi:hypothetical protein